MIAGLPAYPAYKDSGVPWLGRVPVGWEVRRLKTVLRPVDVRSETGTETMLSMRARLGIVPLAEHRLRPVSPEDVIGFKLVRPRQIVVNRMQAGNGLIFESQLHGLISPDYSVLDVIGAANRDYLCRLFRSDAMRAEFRRESKGLGTGTSGFLRLYDDRLGCVAVALPTSQEQQAIALFLGHADRRIQRLIRVKRRAIALLNEQKQAIIHRAVTQGLDPNVRRRDSGVPWLGEVPEHWNLLKLGQCGRIVGGMTPSMSDRENWNGSVPWVSPKDMKVHRLSDSIDHITERALRRCSIELLPVGSVLFVTRGMILARLVPVAISTARVTINQDMKAIIPHQSVCAGFLARLLESARAMFEPLIETAGHGTKRLPSERWKNEMVPVPSMDEQHEIVEYIDDVHTRMQRAISAAEREIALLREFRERLIADVVTGQVDVRAAAARLPPLPEDEGPADLADADAPDDPDDVDADAEPNPDDA